MAGQSITFDFISRGGPALAADFKRTGDNAASAARGAKVLQDVIKTLGDKENRTAAESATLAKALRLTGDAEDRAAAKALAADIAIRRLDDALKDSGKNAGSARGGFAGLAGEVTGFGAAADAATSGGNKFQLAMAGLNLASGVLEPALAGVIVAAGSLAAGFASAGVALGAFGLVAKANFATASTASTAATTAQQAHAAAVAKVTGQYQYAMSVAKTRAQKQAAYAAEQKGFDTAALAQTAALTKAYAGLSPAQVSMAKQITGLKSQWQSFTQGFAPMLNQILGQAAPSFGIILKDIGKLATAGGTAIQALLPSLGMALGSGGFQKFITMLADNAGPAIVKIGVAVGNVVVGIGGILKAFMPTSQTMLSGIDKITAKFREWGTTLSGNSGFASLMATFRTETPQAVAILKNLGLVLVNVGKAIFGLSTFSNSKMLLQLLLPLSGVLASLSKNTTLVRIALYGLAAFKIGSALSWIPGAYAGLVKFSAAAEGATVKEVIAAAATKVWAAAQAVFNAVMDANPIILVAAAAAALGLAFVIAWKKSAAFRDVIKEIGVVMLAVGIVVVRANKAIIDSVLSMVGTILHGMTTAFGWIPGGVGKSLKSASASFDHFKAGTDNVLNGLIGTMQGWQKELNASKNTVAAATASIVRNFQGQGAAARQGRADVAAYSAAVRANRADTDAGRSARQKLINDLIGSGVSARNARGLVNNLQGAINAMRGKTVNVGVHASGSGGMTFTQKVAASISSGGFSLRSLAAGGMISQGTTPTADDVLIRASKGELIVPAHLVPQVKPVLGGKIPGFAGGGIAGMTPWTGGREYDFAQAAEAAFLRAELAQLKKTVAAAAKAASMAAYSAAGPKFMNTGGVMRWDPLVKQALSMERLGAYLASQVEYQMMTESGGNPNAINLTDINAQQGDPSRGLMQVIMSTFRAYHWPGTSWNIYDPLANIAAAINYARHTYGPTLMSGGMGMGSGHGYDQGGWLPVGTSIAVNNTGRPEQVIPAGRGPGGGHVTLEVRGGTHGTFDQFLLKWLRENVRVKGGGDVQKAYGWRA